MPRRVSGGRPLAPEPEVQDVEGALAALSADDLRAVISDVLCRLDREGRGRLEAALLSRAVKGGSGWKPHAPTPGVVSEVEAFVREGVRRGQADPEDVDEWLKVGTSAFLAGEPVVARRIFECLLPPLSDGELYLGQDETLDEVLVVDLHDCSCHYLASVFLTAPLEDRAEALEAALEMAGGVAYLWEPLEHVERALGTALPDADAFLPRWIAHLERGESHNGDFDTSRDRWLREAVLRLEGPGGLERIARRTNRPAALREWCNALVARGLWPEALRAYDEAARLAETGAWRGDFLDGAALAAVKLGLADVTERLEAAWRGAPTLPRLLRWLGTGDLGTEALRARAREALRGCPATEGRQRGLLLLLAGDIKGAAQVLTKAPGLGWSSSSHPGHMLFSAFASLLSQGIRTTVAARLADGLAAALSAEDLMSIREAHGLEGGLPTPSVAAILARGEVAASFGRDEQAARSAAFDAMQRAAGKRVEGLLRNQRRNHYAHGAELVACCRELAPSVDRQREIDEWCQGFRTSYSRYSAFQAELRRMLGS